MRDACAVMALLGCACPAVALADVQADAAPCRYHEEGAPNLSPGQTTVELLKVTPPDGADLTRTVVIGVDVEYHVSGFQPDTYYLLGMFPTQGRGSMSPNDPDNTPALEHSAGRAHLCVPLDEVYEHPTVLWPLTMHVSLLREDADRRGMDLARSGEVRFNAVDMPEGALERQAKAPPIEYRDALAKTAAYFDSRAALYKLCIAHYPAMQPTFTPVYRTWQARHRADIDFVAQAQFENYKTLAKGRADVAARIVDSSLEAARKMYEGMPEAALKSQCESTLSSLPESEDTTNYAIGDELKLVRKYAPAAPGDGR